MVLIGYHPSQPPPLRGTSFQRKEGVSTRAPSRGRGCRAQRGGVGFLFRWGSRLLFAFPLGKGVVSRKAVSSYRHLPHAGKAVIRKSRFPHPTSAPFGAPPSRGRREYPREPLPLEGAAERSEAGVASFFGGEAAAFISDSNFSFVQSFRSRSRDGMPRTYYRRTNE